jgi:hypothetical protein
MIGNKSEKEKGGATALPSPVSRACGQSAVTAASPPPCRFRNGAWRLLAVRGSAESKRRSRSAEPALESAGQQARSGRVSLKPLRGPSTVTAICPG